MGQRNGAWDGQGCSPGCLPSRAPEPAFGAQHSAEPPFPRGAVVFCSPTTDWQGFSLSFAIPDLVARLLFDPYYRFW